MYCCHTSLKFMKLTILIAIFTAYFLAACTTTVKEKSLRFVHLTDLHVTPESVTDSNLNRIVDEINLLSTDFVVVTGDLTNTGSDAELTAVKRALDRLNFPCYVIPGNHETNWSESAALTFNKLWGNDRFIARHKNFLLFGFNTGPFMKMGDGLVKREDILWMKEELENSKNNKEQLLVFAHYPLNEALSNHKEITTLLKKHNTRLVFCGHGHRLSLHNFDSIPGIMGRSVLERNSDIPGYNLVELRGDSIFVTSKNLGAEAGKPYIAFNYLRPDTIYTLPVTKAAEFDPFVLPEEIHLVFRWQDSSSVFAGPCVSGDSLIIFGNSSGHIKALSLPDGKEKWRIHMAGPVYSTPVCSGNIAVLGLVDGSIVGLNIINGEILWKVETGSPVLAEGNIEGDYIYIGAGNKGFYKIRLSSGDVIWKFEDIEGLVQGKAEINNGSVIFGAWDTHLYCLDTETGKLRWKWNNGRPQVLFSPANIYPAISNKKVFIVAPDRYATALDLTDGRQIWRTNRFQVRESMGLSPDGKVMYAKLMNDSVAAISTIHQTFTPLWVIDAGFGYEHSPCPLLTFGKQVIVSTREGTLIGINADTRQINWRYKAGISSANKMLHSGKNRIYATFGEGLVIGVETNNL